MKREQLERKELFWKLILELSKKQLDDVLKMNKEELQEFAKEQTSD